MCAEEIDMAVIEMSMKEIEYERLKEVLKDLKESAKCVDEYENSVYAEYRILAEIYKTEIINTLLILEI